MSTVLQEDCVGLAVNPTLINPVTSAPLDLTTAVVVTFIFLGPNTGERYERVGIVDGDPLLGKVIYPNVAADFASPGPWKYQVKVQFASGAVFYSTVSKVKVKANI